METSVIVVAYNEEGYIKECLRAILNQSFPDFELLVIDDCSTDKTAQFIREFADPRIRYIKNERNCGIAESRNVGIRNAKGGYIFFTDADCEPTKYWLEEGLRVLRGKKFIGVRGRTFYATAKTTISDRTVESLSGNEYRTCNIAYTKEILEKAGFFNPEYEYFDDADLALRIEMFSDIIFSKDMIVIHQQKKYNVKRLFRDAKKITGSVTHFVKDHRNYHCKELDFTWGRVIFPKKLLIIIFPFLLFFYHSFRSWHDIKMIPFIYLSAVYLRLRIWKSAIKEKVFFI